MVAMVSRHGCHGIQTWLPWFPCLFSMKTVKGYILHGDHAATHIQGEAIEFKLWNTHNSMSAHRGWIQYTVHVNVIVESIEIFQSTNIVLFVSTINNVHSKFIQKTKKDNICQQLKIICTLLRNHLILWARNFMVWWHWTCSWTLEFVHFKFYAILVKWIRISLGF